MSEQNQEGTSSESTGSEGSPAAPGATASKASSILEQVEGLISGSKDEVFKRVVESLAETEKARRVDLVLKGLVKKKEAFNNFRKLNKPDSETLDFSTMKPIPMISKAKAEELKKAKEALDKIEKALELALNDNDFSKLAESCK